jgi:hypothetical protein
MIYLTHDFCIVTLAKKVLIVRYIIALNLHRPCLTLESTVYACFIFQPSPIHVSPIEWHCLLRFPSRCRLSSSPCWHATTSCCASFTWNQDKFTTCALSFGNTLSSHHLPSQAEMESLNLHHHRLPPSAAIKRPSWPRQLSPPLNPISILPPP